MADYRQLHSWTETPSGKTDRGEFTLVWLDSSANALELPIVDGGSVIVTRPDTAIWKEVRSYSNSAERQVIVRYIEQILQYPVE
jgi:hypothetical protein